MRIAKLALACVLALASAAAAQNRPVKIAYSAISAGIGGLWLTHEQGIFKKHGLDSSLIYFRSGTTATQALLAGEIQFGHLAPGAVMTAWAQGADFVWIGTTVHKMVFTLVAEPAGIPSPPFSTAALEAGYRRLVFIPDLGKEFTFSGIAVKRDYLAASPQATAAFMAALTEGAKIYKEDAKAALRVLKKYVRVENESLLEAGYREYATALTSPPYPSIKGLEAVRESLVDTAPMLKNVDLRKFVDDRFVRSK